METRRLSTEELDLRTAQLDAVMQDAGFHMAFSDSEASRDFGYRARYVRGKSTFFPLLEAAQTHTGERTKKKSEAGPTLKKAVMKMNREVCS
jgi:hypothetical protein